LLAVLLLGLGGVFAVYRLRSGGSPSAELGTSPGFSATSRPLDTSPYRLATGQASGSTTIPNAILGGGATGSTEPGRFSGSGGSRVTTTTAPPRPALPPTSSIQSICGASRSLSSLAALTTDPSLNGQALGTALLANMKRYNEVASPTQRLAVAAVAEGVTRLMDILRTAGWKGTDSRFVAAIDAVSRRRPPFADFLAKFDALGMTEAGACPSAAS
jgi:hypothetical protein